MIQRFGNAVLEAGSLVLTDRRWTAPLSAIAVGFGLFVGIAIGPGSTPTFAGGGQVIEVMVPPPAAGPAATQAPAPAPAPAPDPAPAPAPAPASVAQSESTSAAPTTSGPGGKPGPKKPAGPFLAGTVVQLNTVAGSYSLAAPGGQLYAIHARSLPVQGTRVKTAFRLLANGTYAERGKRTRSGQATSAEVSGVVTFVDTVAPRGAYTLSAPGVSLWVRTPAASGQTAPPVGAFATAQVGLEPPPAPSVPPPQTPDTGTVTPPVTSPNQVPVQPTAPAAAQPASCARAAAPAATSPESVLVQRSVVSEQALSTYGELAGTVQAICPDTAQLLISADAIREGAQDVSITVPPGFDLTRMSVDDPVVATAAIAAGGGLSLSGLASDRGIAGADDRSALQGDLQGG